MLDDPTAGTRLGTVTVIAAGDDWGIYGMQEIDLTQPVSGLHGLSRGERERRRWRRQGDHV